MMKWLKRYKFQIIAIGLGLFLLSSFIPIRLAIARNQAPTPQAILVLEGDSARIRFAAQFSMSHPNLPIWVSGQPEHLFFNRSVFRQAGVPLEQVHFDADAVDTVTNFTCTVEHFLSQNIQHIYLITSDYHMRRSLTIAAVVFGSRGITVTPVSISSQNRQPESLLRVARDFLRSLFWILTGKTGASFRYFTH